MCLNHPETISSPPFDEKLSSTKSAPGAKKVGDGYLINRSIIYKYFAFLVVQLVENPPAMQETWV